MYRMGLRLKTTHQTPQTFRNHRKTKLNGMNRIILSRNYVSDHSKSLSKVDLNHQPFDQAMKNTVRDFCEERNISQRDNHDLQQKITEILNQFEKKNTGEVTKDIFEMSEWERAKVSENLSNGDEKRITDEVTKNDIEMCREENQKLKEKLFQEKIVNMAYFFTLSCCIVLMVMGK